VPVKRVQAAIVVTGWLRKRFGWHELRLQSLASDGEKEKDHQVVPFGKLGEIDPVLDEIAIRRPDDAQRWEHSHHIVAIGPAIGATAAAIGGSIALYLGNEVGWLGLVAAPLIALIAWWAARYHRWADIGDQVAIRRGFWKPKMTLLPHASVQSVDLKTDFLLRPLGLATLVFGVPGGSSLPRHEIPAIPLGCSARAAHCASSPRGRCGDERSKQPRLGYRARFKGQPWHWRRDQRRNGVRKSRARRSGHAIAARARRRRATTSTASARRPCAASCPIRRCSATWTPLPRGSPTRSSATRGGDDLRRLRRRRRDLGGVARPPAARARRARRARISPTG
jgi:membrane protein YdbS with pleckstrin-like domain